MQANQFYGILQPHIQETIHTLLRIEERERNARTAFVLMGSLMIGGSFYFLAKVLGSDKETALSTGLLMGGTYAAQHLLVENLAIEEEIKDKLAQPVDQPTHAPKV